MIGDLDVQMIEDVVGVRLVLVLVHDAGVSWLAVRIHVAADREAVGAVLLLALDRIAEGKRHIIDDEMMLIVAQNSVRDRVQLVVLIAIAQIVALRTQMSTCVVQEADLIRRRPNALTEHDLSEIFHWRLLHGALTEVEMTVLVRQGQLHAIQSINVQFDLGFTFFGEREREIG